MNEQTNTRNLNTSMTSMAASSLQVLKIYSVCNANYRFSILSVNNEKHPMCLICIKDLVHFPSVSEANILATWYPTTQPTANKLRDRNGTSLFDNARQGRDSLLDNWALVFVLLLIHVSTHDARFMA